MATIDGSWHPGIGDPTPIGWLTVLAYAVAAWQCWSVASHVTGERSPTAAARNFWRMLTAGMAALGVNKQLDLQTAFTEIGRAAAQYGGWYAQRHQVQIAFIGLVGVLGVLVLALLARLSSPLSRGRLISLVGLVFLGAFVMIRAASFHHVDLLINDTVFGLRWNWIIELGGIGMVAGGALIERRAGLARAGRRRQPPGDDRQVISHGDPRSRNR